MAKEINLGDELGAEGEPAAQRLTLYIPNKDRDGQAVAQYDKWVKEARELLTKIGKGATAYPPVDGNWEKPDGSVLWEQTRVIYTFIDPDRLAANMGTLREFLHRFGRETNQGEVIVEFDGLMWTIRQFDPPRERVMAERVKIVGAEPKRVEITDKPKRRIEPAELAAALGADPKGEYVGANLDLISLAELGTQLLNRLRSTGGRPALSDATEVCRVPLSSEDVAALEEITKRIEESTGTKSSPGQIVSVIVRDYLQSTKTKSTIATATGSEAAVNHGGDMLDAWMQRLTEIANTVRETATAIEAAADDIKREIDFDVHDFGVT